VLRDGFAFREIALCTGYRLGRGDLEMLTAHAGTGAKVGERVIGSTIATRGTKETHR
jgi:hypothetical protein